MVDFINDILNDYFISVAGKHSNGYGEFIEIFCIFFFFVSHFKNRVSKKRLISFREKEKSIIVINKSFIYYEFISFFSKLTIFSFQGK